MSVLWAANVPAVARASSRPEVGMGLSRAFARDAPHRRPALVSASTHGDFGRRPKGARAKRARGRDGRPRPPRSSEAEQPAGVAVTEKANGAEAADAARAAVVESEAATRNARAPADAQTTPAATVPTPSARRWPRFRSSRRRRRRAAAGGPADFADETERFFSLLVATRPARAASSRTLLKLLTVCTVCCSSPRSPRPSATPSRASRARPRRGRTSSPAAARWPPGRTASS